MREKLKTYRYTCDGMKSVTHAKDGREYTHPMVALCSFQAVFQACDQWAADRVARDAGWVVDEDTHYCEPSHTPWHSFEASQKSPVGQVLTEPQEGRDWVNNCCEHGCDCGERYSRSPDQQDPHHCATGRSGELQEGREQ